VVAEWLRGFVPGIPVGFLAAGEPFHRPLSGFDNMLAGRKLTSKASEMRRTQA